MEQKSSGRGVFTSLNVLFGAAAGALVTALVKQAEAQPAWLVVLVLGLLIVALLVLIGTTWLNGSWVHIREHQRCLDDVARWRDLAMATNQVNKVAVPLAIEKVQSTS